MIDKNINSPETSSIGRLFDGVSATDAIQALLTREECHEYQGLVWEDDK